LFDTVQEGIEDRGAACARTALATTPAAGVGPHARPTGAPRPLAPGPRDRSGGPRLLGIPPVGPDGPADGAAPGPPVLRHPRGRYRPRTRRLPGGTVH